MVTGENDDSDRETDSSCPVSLALVLLGVSLLVVLLVVSLSLKLSPEADNTGRLASEGRFESDDGVEDDVEEVEEDEEEEDEEGTVIKTKSSASSSSLGSAMGGLNLTPTPPAENEARDTGFMGPSSLLVLALRFLRM